MRKSELRQLVREEIKKSLKENPSMGPRLKWDAHNEIVFGLYDRTFDDEENEDLSKFSVRIEWQDTAMGMANELMKAANEFKQLAQSKYKNNTLNIDPMID